jgi:hypothetical protein
MKLRDTTPYNIKRNSSGSKNGGKNKNGKFTKVRKDKVMIPDYK